MCRLQISDEALNNFSSESAHLVLFTTNKKSDSAMSRVFIIIKITGIMSVDYLKSAHLKSEIIS
jgi:hypothetical protein